MKRGGLLALLTTGHAFEHWYLGLMGPLMPFLAQDLGFSLTQVGVLVTGRAVFGAFSSAGSGWATDRLGSGRAMLIFCLAGIALLYGGIAFAPGFAVLAPIYWASGLAGQTWHPPSMGLLGEIFRDRKGFAFGIHGTGASLGQSIAPVVAGYLLLVMNWRQVILWNMLPLLAVSVMLALWLPSIQPGAQAIEKGAPDTSALDWLRQVRDSLLRNPELLAVCFTSGVRTLTQNIVITFLPFFLVRELGASAGWVGIALGVFTSASILPETLMGYLSDRIPRQRILFTGIIVGGLILLFIPAWGGSAVLLLLLAVLGAFFISTRSVVFALGIEVSPRSLGGSVVGLIFTTNQVFVGAGSLSCGVLADALGPGAVFWFTGGLVLLSYPLLLLLMRSAAAQRAAAAPEAGPVTPAP
ncbi:MAG: hypothetical protein A3J27_04235 [Candidatus Tectomicrobia bacterium RIFCSPLOWO2_12_FULL_69_37]|nr:MAG: hypothetical protein A3I72_17015 [Candidatus Tectomicrobia bacterium RIFCSPLOWO2_02_FULL_70_19]OGL68172.1 MAG: hypothetical protein A3J27_04235 [Candidatus Tectomicrobia bacterium RIFCSPLOWO2_12_FULL_69_37]